MNTISNSKVVFGKDKKELSKRGVVRPLQKKVLKLKEAVKEDKNLTVAEYKTFLGSQKIENINYKRLKKESLKYVSELSIMTIAELKGECAKFEGSCPKNVRKSDLIKSIVNKNEEQQKKLRNEKRKRQYEQVMGDRVVKALKMNKYIPVAKGKNPRWGVNQFEVPLFRAKPTGMKQGQKTFYYTRYSGRFTEDQMRMIAQKESNLLLKNHPNAIVSVNTKFEIGGFRSGGFTGAGSNVKVYDGTKSAIPDAGNIIGFDIVYAY